MTRRTSDPAVVLGASGPSFITAQGADEAYRPVPLIGFRMDMSAELVEEMAVVGPLFDEAFGAALGVLVWEGDQA